MVAELGIEALEVLAIFATLLVHLLKLRQELIEVFQGNGLIAVLPQCVSHLSEHIAEFLLFLADVLKQLLNLFLVFFVFVFLFALFLLIS